MAKIYTKTGDQGETGLFGGPRIPKSDRRLEAYGTLDELNSHLGLTRHELLSLREPRLSSMDQLLRSAQNELFSIGSHLALGDESYRGYLPPLNPRATTELEASIDSMTAEMPPLKEFILPGGCRLASLLHISRTVCRRAERRVVDLLQDANLPEGALQYLNRLSDFLFVAARFANHCSGNTDCAWKKPQTPE